jgi:ribonuclease G
VNKELVINSTSSGVEIALLEDKRLVELHYDNDDQYAVGDLYLGRVRKIAAGLNAVFVEIGHSKDAFLHYTDLSPQFKSLQKFTQAVTAPQQAGAGFDYGNMQLEPEILKTGKITDVLKTRDQVLVQILKEPISSKGPRISCELTLPGRFIVLSPFNNFVTISRKITNNDERKRLQRIIEAIKPKNFGVIVRTAAEGQSTAELHQDLLDLAASWTSMQENLAKSTAPSKILSEKNKTTSILRDLLNEDFNAVICNDEHIIAEAKTYVSRIAPDKIKIVSGYKSTVPIFDHYGISKQVKSSFGKTVMLPTGGYLIIERTEAMHVVDVNSGHKFGKENQEETSLSTNVLAAKELARQLRLRDLGGIIIVDFIDMKNPDHKKVVFNEMELAMRGDRARHSILPVSKFGLMQITRQRLRPEIEINTGETCPTCLGTGAVRSTTLITDDIENKLAYIIKQGTSQLALHVNPILYSHFTKTKGFFGTNNLNKEWNKRLGAKIKIVEEQHYELISYTIHDGVSGEEIKL